MKWNRKLKRQNTGSHLKSWEKWRRCVYIVRERGCTLWKRRCWWWQKNYGGRWFFFPSTPPPSPADSMTISFQLNSSVSYISVFPSHFLSPLLFPFHYTLPLRLCNPLSTLLAAPFLPSHQPSQVVQAPLCTLFSPYRRADSSSSLSLLPRCCLNMVSHVCQQRDQMGPGK